MGHAQANTRVTVRRVNIRDMRPRLYVVEGVKEDEAGMTSGDERGLIDVKVHEHSMRVTTTHSGTKRSMIHHPPPHPNIVRLSDRCVFEQSFVARSCRH